MDPIPFLKEIATLLLQPGAYNITETCIVFPNKRARLYLSKYLGEITDKPIWAPAYLTINELMEKASGYLYADRWTLIFELFDVYTEVTKLNETFDAFYPYSETLLADFDEVDKYLINADDLFNNLVGLKAMEGRFNYLSDEQIAAIRRFWSTFDPENISDGQKTFISLWDCLPAMYRKFKERLHSYNLSYEGMAYRKVVEDLNTGTAMNWLEYQKYIFVGFNALNTCEEKLFRFVKNQGRAEFFWDYDSWYMNNELHEAGFFLRKNLKNFPQLTSINHENLSSKRKRIFFMPVSSNSGQAGALPFIFEKLDIREIHIAESTAVVLADENLLIPVLYAIPGNITDVNITMGYPLAGSAVFNLIDSLYELIRNAKREADGTTSWRYKEVLAIMGNPLLKALYGGIIEQVRQRIIEHNIVYLHEADIWQDHPDDVIFNDKLKSANLCEYLLEITGNLIRRLPVAEEKSTPYDSVHHEILFQIYTFLTRLQDILVTRNFVPGVETLFRLIRKIMRTMHIPFNGEPLAGLQVLGILETRTLDFDHVIILSANEGILPRASELPSFIPRSLRVGFGLPAPEHHDAIYAYYFYRLIQRASDVVLVYDNTTGGLRTGERSRFLHQLAYEMNLSDNEITPVSNVAHIPVKPVIIKKVGSVAVALLKYSGKEGKVLSPSAMNEFLDCSLRFYFHHIAALPQPDDVTEEIDPRMFGNLLHKAMKFIYSDFGDSKITGERLEALLKNEKTIDEALDKAFNVELFGEKRGTGSRKAEGYNLIIRQILRTYIYQLIHAEIKMEPFSIVSLEERYVTSFPVFINGVQHELNMGGIIDRIDRYEGKTRIIDYKTGTLKDRFTSIESLFDSSEKLRNDAVFQVLLYASIYNRLFPGSTIVPGLGFIRDSHADSYSYDIQYSAIKAPLDNFATVEKEFETLMEHHLARLFDTREPFRQTENLMVCSFCPYAAICRRESKEL